MSDGSIELSRHRGEHVEVAYRVVGYATVADLLRRAAHRNLVPIPDPRTLNRYVAHAYAFAPGLICNLLTAENFMPGTTKLATLALKAAVGILFVLATLNEGASNAAELSGRGFRPVLDALVPEFERTTGHKVTISDGTGRATHKRHWSPSRLRPRGHQEALRAAGIPGSFGSVRGPDNLRLVAHEAFVVRLATVA